MPKRTPDKIRDGNKRPRPPYTPKTSIRNITEYLITQLSCMGLTVVVSRSRISKSRYLEIDVGKRWYTIRISDHALRQGGKYDFDVYTETSREKSWNYLSLVRKFRAILGDIDGQAAGFSANVGKFGRS